MQGKIFVLQDDHTLRPLEESRFESEDLFQGLLERYPDLLAGEQMNAADPRRWLLVSREYGIPGAEGAGIRWAVDHLFLDQEGIPTLVEVKRSTDTRIRREVVGQMLDYAANAVVYWPIERIRATFEASCQVRGEDPSTRIAELLGDSPEGADVDPFWARVGTNLLAGRIRLVFVADIIPDELRRIIEFLNGQMTPAEVLGVEIRHFAGQGIRTLVPQVIGGTAAAEQKKSKSGEIRFSWDESSFFAHAKKNLPTESLAALRTLYDFCRERAASIAWGTGRNGSFNPRFAAFHQRYSPFSVYGDGVLYIKLAWIREDSADRDVIERLARAFSNVLGDLVPSDLVTREAYIPASAWGPKVGALIGALDSTLG